jgi:hypothetical protein
MDVWRSEKECYGTSEIVQNEIDPVSWMFCVQPIQPWRYLRAEAPYCIKVNGMLFFFTPM